MVTMKVLTQWEFPENSTEYLQKKLLVLSMNRSEAMGQLEQ